jgi:SNF2 family DNA or RNA helicase
MTSELAIIADVAPPVDVAGLSLPHLHEKMTREGTCHFREMRLHFGNDHAFRAAWKKHKRQWLERGYSLRQINGSWILQQWLLVDGEQLRLTPIGQERLNEFVNPQAEMQLEADAVQLDLPELPADIAGKLFEYQIEPARQLLRAVTHGPQEWGYPGAWDCSDMGVGKTFQALAAALATGLEVGVVCPLAVIPSWKRAFAHFGKQPPLFVMNYESLRTGNREWVKIEPIPNGSGKRFAWTVKPEDTIIIFDEAHNMKSTGKKTQALGIAAIRQKIPSIFCSGTLARDPTEMRASGRVVGLHAGGADFEKFMLDHNCEGSGIVWKFFGGRRGREALARIHRRVFPSRGARVRIADLGDRFPETQILAESFDTGETQKIAAAFKEAEELLSRMAAQGASEQEIRMRKASAYMEAWHQSERLKVPALAEMARLEMEEGRSVAIFCNFVDCRMALMDALATKCAIYGGQNPQHREACIADFQADRSRVIVANIDAGGVGVSLHDINGEFPRTAIILPTNKVVSMTQALGRVHRAGGKSRSRQVIFFAAGTVEEQICDVTRRRMAQITTLNDGELYPDAKF